MIITIARQTGSGALQVGRLLAAHYQIPFYTRRALLDKARQTGVLDEMDDFFEERPVDELQYAISAFEETAIPRNAKAIRLLQQLIGNEDCVVIGRCGNYIFRDREDLVSVFLKGSRKQRIFNLAKEENVSVAVAEERLDEQDDDRQRYHHYYTGLQWGNAADYDLCFDVLRMGYEHAAEMIEHYITILGISHSKGGLG